MGKRILALLIMMALLAGAVPASAEEDYRAADGNEENFGQLLIDLYKAYHSPSPEDTLRIEQDVEAIRTVYATDGEIARAIADHWEKVYLDPGYRLCLYEGEPQADGLELDGIAEDGTHAFVVLGYELKDGKMTRELKGRCDAAVAAARSYPGAILVCAGGATGENNPKNHTEAGMMKKYLVRECGIEESRIFIDEKAMTTLENAVNTFRVLQEQGVRTITVVTSS